MQEGTAGPLQAILLSEHPHWAASSSTYARAEVHLSAMRKPG